MLVSLLENQSLHQRTDGFPAAASDYMTLEFMLSPTEINDPQKNELQEWLSRVGLNLNPFEYIDAGKDPLIPFYLIDHDQFDKVSGGQPSFVFAPAGGGKTAFRVRLARECRAGRNGRRIFPIVYKPTKPGGLNETKEDAAHRQRTDLLGCAAQELFLHLAYYPYALDEMEATLKEAFLQTISWDLEFSIAYYLNQMKVDGSLEPLINAFDPTARSLPNPPGKDDILYLYKKLIRYVPSKEKPNDNKRLEILFDLVINKLKFESIYILVDGVDVFPETANSPDQMLVSISWLLNNTQNLTKKNIYVKYFLPHELHPLVIGTSAFRPLTLQGKIIIIKWDADALNEVIRQRLQEASGGKFDSLAAISDRALRASGRSPEEIMIADLRRFKKLNPRSLIRAVNWLFTNHVQDERVREKLTPQDLTATREWIRREYSAKEQSA